MDEKEEDVEAEVGEDKRPVEARPKEEIGVLVVLLLPLGFLRADNDAVLAVLAVEALDTIEEMDEFESSRCIFLRFKLLARERELPDVGVTVPLRDD